MRLENENQQPHCHPPLIYIIISIYFFIISFFYHPYPMLYDSEDWTHILEMHIMRKHALIGIAVATFFIYFIKEIAEDSVIPVFFILIFLTVIILFIILIINIYIFIISFFITPISHTLQFRGLDACSRRCIGACPPDRRRMDDFSHSALGRVFRPCDESE